MDFSVIASVRTVTALRSGSDATVLRLPLQRTFLSVTIDARGLLTSSPANGIVCSWTTFSRRGNLVKCLRSASASLLVRITCAHAHADAC